MKKFFLTLAVALVCSVTAFAQHAGQFGIGANIGVAPCVEKDNSVTNFVLGGRLQYSATDLIRLAVDLNGGFEDKHWSTFTATANVHFMIPVANSFYLYPLAGIGYGNLHWGYDDFSDNLSRFVFNVGIGGEYEFSSNFAAGLEFKYQYMKDWGRLPVLLNLSYKF